MTIHGRIWQDITSVGYLHDCVWIWLDSVSSRPLDFGGISNLGGAERHLHLNTTLLSAEFWGGGGIWNFFFLGGGGNFPPKLSGWNTDGWISWIARLLWKIQLARVPCMWCHVSYACMRCHVMWLRAGSCSYLISRSRLIYQNCHRWCVMRPCVKLSALCLYKYIVDYIE